MKKLLDIGCGPGTISNLGYYYKREKEYKIYGIDFLKNNIQAIKKRYPKGVFAVAKAEKLPFNNAEFSSILSRHVLEHVTDLDKTLSEMNRVLKKGSTIVIAVPHEKLEKHMNRMIPHYFEHGHHHERMFTKKSLRSALIQHGFKVTSLKDKKWALFLIDLSLAHISKLSGRVKMEEQSGVFTVNKKSYLDNKVLYPLYMAIFSLIELLDMVLPFINSAIPFEMEVYAKKK